MARGGTVKIKGARQLRAALRKAGADMSNLTVVNRGAAEVVAHAAATLAPVRTGRLAASVRAGATQTTAIVRGGYASVPYAGVIHWGWAARHIEPHPFITDAAANTEAAWTALYFRALERAVTDIANSTQGAAA